MVAYNFQAMFIDPIRERRKRQTIRALGKRRHARPGDTLKLYTGMRTKHCQMIGEATCLSVEVIRLSFSPPSVTIYAASGAVAAEHRTSDKLDTFARDDGFDHWHDLALFWDRHHSTRVLFRGLLIRWGGFRAHHRVSPDINATSSGGPDAGAIGSIPWK